MSPLSFKHLLCKLLLSKKSNAFSIYGFSIKWSSILPFFSLFQKHSVYEQCLSYWVEKFSLRILYILSVFIDSVTPKHPTWNTHTHTCTHRCECPCIIFQADGDGTVNGLFGRIGRKQVLCASVLSLLSPSRVPSPASVTTLTCSTLAILLVWVPNLPPTQASFLFEL